MLKLAATITELAMLLYWILAGVLALNLIDIDPSLMYSDLTAKGAEYLAMSNTLTEALDGIPREKRFEIARTLRPILNKVLLNNSQRDFGLCRRLC